MMALEMNRLNVTNRGARKMKTRNTSGEPMVVEAPHKGLRNPIDATKNSQKKVNMLPMEPTRSPNANGSLHPPLTGIVEKTVLGEKSTPFIVCFTPCHSPSCMRLSHGVERLFFSSPSPSLLTNSNLLPHLGHRTHRVREGILSRGMSLA